MSNHAPADERLDKVAAELISRGLHVNIPVDKPLSPGDPDADFIWVHNPASGQYAQVSYVSSGSHPADVFLELTYRTAPDEDPDGAHMADRVVLLLFAAPISSPAVLRIAYGTFAGLTRPGRSCRVMG
ncbi:MAG TPA: hypothetical protein VIY52_25460 [Streptosporangiaceae bacterium]